MGALRRLAMPAPFWGLQGSAGGVGEWDEEDDELDEEMELDEEDDVGGAKVKLRATRWPVTGGRGVCSAIPALAHWCLSFWEGCDPKRSRSQY